MKENNVWLVMLTLFIPGNLAARVDSIHPAVPRLFAPGVVSTPLDELNATFSPPGDRVYFTVNAPGGRLSVILESRKKNSKWSTPTKASFSSGKDADCDPWYSADGSKLYFISNRLVPGQVGTPKNFDIYFVLWKNNKWSEPVNLGPVINDTGDQYYPSLAANGNLYFSAKQDSSYDIYCAEIPAGTYQTPRKLLGKLNSVKDEVDIAIAPDESYLIVTVYGREDSKGGGDLYISFNTNGLWSEVVPLGPTINTAAREYCPVLFNSHLYFTSTRGFLEDADFTPFSDYKQVKNTLSATLNGSGNIYSLPLSKSFIDRLRGRVVN